MTNEELEKLQSELSGQIKQLADIPEGKITRTERKRLVVLQARKEALDKIKKARDDGSVNEEARAGLDYTIITKYGEKNIFLYNFMKARMSWWNSF